MKPWNCALGGNNLRRELVSLLELPITFDERSRVTSVPFFIPDIKLQIRQFYI